MAATSATDAMAMDLQSNNSPLSKIPVEVLLRITYYIPTEDLGNMRLTCKAIERSLFHFFSHEFFSKKQFMAYTISLQALLDISKHPGLAPCLKHLIICTDRYYETYTHGAVSRNTINISAFNQVCDDQNSLLSTGLLRDYLVEAITNLPNLETVDFRDFNSPTRNRDSTSTARAYWASYGVNTLQRQIGFRPNVDAGADFDRIYSQKHRSQLFQATLAALGAANARPNALEVVLRKQGLPDSSFNIPPRLESSIAPMLSALKKLHLVFLPPGRAQSTPRGAANIRKFLRLAPNVTWLRLNFSQDAHFYGAGTLFEEQKGLLYWITGVKQDGVTPLDDPTDAPSFQLETLDFGSVSGSLVVNQALVLRLVSHFSRTLRSLSLRRVILDCSTDDVTDKVNVWANLIRSFSRVPHLDLRQLSLGWVKQGVNVSVELSGGMEHTYKADSLSKLISAATASIQPLWPKEPTPVKDEEMEDDEEEEDEDDEMDSEEEEDDE